MFYFLHFLANFLLLSFHSANGRFSSLSIEEDLQLEKELKSLNKPPLKTIKTQYGDIYDCVDIYEQPALDNPLLEHHKIQTSPSFGTKSTVSSIPTPNKTLSHSLKIGATLRDACPRGTVPIRRTSKEELLRAKTSFTQQFQPSYSTKDVGPPKSAIFFAGISAASRNATTYYGAGGYVSVYNPNVSLGQFSASVISIEGGPVEQFSTIRVGWMVNINQFGDAQTRLYTIWGQAVNGVMHGCYNTYCSGFVQLNPQIALGMVLEPISIIRGPQYYVKLEVQLDKSSGNWWLLYGETDTPVGYWSSSLFTSINSGADVLRWGGMAYSSTPELPTMGNGLTDDFFGCHFRRVALKYEAGSSLNGTLDAPLAVAQTGCYKIGDNSYKGDFWGYSFWFGGNGGDAKQCT
ncbi:protein neprosin-like [Ziziphus jujuba]|uniref:Protein neprosin-like n=1 Tax=Ziziphus jujuba TaxID=326968 RepID=A0ABM3ILG1_ZIZJJ|nr:protein neprosin-like [Ziziphus jujuba]